MEFDVFISHATEDKAAIAEPLEQALRANGIKVWMDTLNIGWGESLGSAIDAGLSQSRYGLVILSPFFFKKEWPKRELDGLIQRQIGERRIVVLPLYHEIDNEDVRSYSPTLAAAKALDSRDGIPQIVAEMKKRLERVDDSTGASPQELSEGRAIFSRAKSLIEEGRVSRLEDLLIAETDSLLRIVAGDEFDPNENPGSEENYFNAFKRRITSYEHALARLNRVQVATVYYGSAETNVPLRRSLERVAAYPMAVGKQSHGGKETWISLQQYPAILSYYRVAAAAIASERWVNMRPLIRDAQMPERPLAAKRIPMLAGMRPHVPFKARQAWLPTDEFHSPSRNYTPAEDYLASGVTESLSWLAIDPDEAERIFDIWMLLAQIAYLGIPESQGRWGTCFSAGRWWCVARVFHGWDNSPQGQFIQRVVSEGDTSEILRSGICDGSAKLFAERGAEAAKIIVEASKRW